MLKRGLPLLLRIDTSLDLSVLREKYQFEIVAEQEEGYVIVASEDIELGPFKRMVAAFAVEVHGSVTVASIHKLFDDPADRLRRVPDHTIRAINSPYSVPRSQNSRNS